MHNIILDVSLIAIICVLGINIQRSYVKGVANINNTEKENAELQVLLKKQQELKELEDYFSSPEYQKSFLRDNLNMAEQGESLYEIRYYEEKNESSKSQVYEIPENAFEINNNNAWRKYVLKL